jgi:hypothetical protein
MRHLKVATLLILAALVCVAVAQTVAGAGLRILSPKSGEKISTDFVTVQYEAATGVTAAGRPTFRVRLDSSDPVNTTDTEYTCTGLAPGTHTVTVQVVDANGTPIVGAQGQVQFTVLSPQQNRGVKPQSPQAAAQPDAAAQLVPAAMTSQPSGQNPQEPLPQAGSPLPVLSVIGMGVLLGGIASALRTRPK